MQANVDSVSLLSSSYPNVRARLGGVGAREERIYLPAGTVVRAGRQVEHILAKVGARHRNDNAYFVAYPIDTLFANERLGFAHIDVEGSELEALRGAHAVFARDQPIFTAELHVHSDPKYTQELLAEIAALGYDAYMVEESCSTRADGRNLICLPRSRYALLAGSPALATATSARLLRLVNVSSIAHTAFPCCAAGGACCPSAGARGVVGDCCRWRTRVNAWIEANPHEAAAFSSVSWYDARNLPRWPPLGTFSQRESELGLVPRATGASGQPVGTGPAGGVIYVP
jgi:hypothetical protein